MAASIAASDNAITFTAAPGEANGLVVSNPTGTEITFQDTFPVPVTETSESCAPTGFSSVSCDVGTLFVLVILDLGDGRDTADAAAAPFSVFANGGDGADTISTGSGNDALQGGPGADTLSGGGGDDLVDGGFDPDQIDGGEDADLITYESRAAGVEVALGDGLDNDGNADDGPVNGRDSLVGIENVIGTPYDDTIIGDGADNLIDGRFGSDILEGLSGIDTLSYSGRTDNVAVVLGQTAGNGGAGDGAGDAIDEFEHLIGGEGNDSLTGNGAGNAIRGQGGDDTLNGAEADDLLDGGEGDDAIDGQAGDDQAGLFGSAGEDTISGGPGDDALAGGAGADSADGGVDDDVLRGGGGDDALAGGEGSDTASFDASPSGVVANLTDGTAGGEGADTLAGFEDLTGSAYADLLVGDAGANTLSGLGGADGPNLYEGRAEHDRFVGGTDEDTVSYANETATIADLATTAANSGGTDDFVTSIENLIGSPEADTLTGTSGPNELAGLGGDDTLVGLAADDEMLGGEGADTLRPGAGSDEADGEGGDDTVDYSDSASRVIVNLVSDSVDENDAGTLDAIPAVENVVGSPTPGTDHITGDGAGNRISALAGPDTVLAGGGPDDIRGGADEDLIFAGDGDDTMAGDGGQDQLNGQADLDTVSYAAAAAGVSVDLSLDIVSDDGDGSSDLLANGDVENVVGSGFADSIWGRDLQANALDGGGGNDMIGGLGGNDDLDGQGGTDTASYATAPAGVIVSLAAGSSAGGHGSDALAGFENARGSSGHGDLVVGDGSANVLDGMGGNDTLLGAGGPDTLAGGPGRDAASYVSAATGVNASLDTDTAANDGDGSTDTFLSIQEITGSSHSDDLTGSAGSPDTIKSLGGDDVVRSRDASADELDCGAGSDRALIDASELSISDCEIADDPRPTATPVIAGSNPPSGVNENAPEILGSAPAGSTVTLYGSSSCGGPPLASGSAAAFAAPGLTINVPDDSTTTLTARAADPNDMDGPSACSAPLTYVERTAAATPPPKRCKKGQRLKKGKCVKKKRKGSKKRKGR